MNSQFIQSVFIKWDNIGQDSYLRRIEALKGISSLEFDNNVTFFVGENGSGKSTVLESLAITSGFNPEGGTKNYRFSTFDSHSELFDAVKLSRGVRTPGWGYFLRAESFYNVATKEMEYAGIKSERFHEKSHGESFLTIAQQQFRPEGLYFLDEPEAALSPQRQLTLLLEINECAKQDSQFFIVTHSPILLGLPGATILTFDDGQIHSCEYEETESFQVMDMFINNREQILKRLLG